MSERVRRPLPSLGPRGEGWFIAQLVFIVAVALAPVQAWPTAIESVGRPIGLLLLVAGFLVAAGGILALGTNLTPFPRPRADGSLVDHGIYAHVRHPIYSGLILLAFGWALWRSSLVGLLLSAAFAVFLDLKARREEAFLAEAFPGYEAYRRRTRRFAPGLY